ncbi:hypothetical protein Taro_010893 [Colocasia esculenta]|uniref:CCHC-type domain-containing protein n=1 Tax=Colocasia esculenta TaxID=4460 RepID=A0A843U4B7_COLES|nr:hypothetical protein [Colocasia esculenta]
MPNSTIRNKDGAHEKVGAKTQSKAKAAGCSFGNVDVPWIVGGDFNYVSQPSKKMGGSSANLQAMLDFNAFISGASLTNAGYIGSNFTWSNNCIRQAAVKARLDRFLLNSNCDSMYIGLKVRHLPKGPSDHAPLMVTFSSSPPVPARFTFLSMWITHGSFKDTVKAAWEESLKAVRGVLRSWNKDTFGNINDNLLRHEEEDRALQEAFDADPMPDNRSAMGAANANIRKAVNCVELFWAQKARMQWLDNGDKNTAFYHAVVQVKNLWNIRHGSSFWASYARRRYHTGSNNNFPGMSTKIRLEADTIVQNNTRWVHGKGNNIDILRDIWVGDKPLSDLLQATYEGGSVSLQEVISDASHPIRSLLPSGILHGLVLNDEEDKCVWGASQDGSFSSKCSYNLEFLVAGELWNDHKKVIFFLYSSATTCATCPLGVEQREADGAIKKDELVLYVGETNKKRKAKKTLKKGNGKGKKSGKEKVAKKEPAKDKGQCFHCGKNGNWKRNCKEYLTEKTKQKLRGS